MSSKPNFLNLTLKEIEDLLASWEEPSFRAKQIFQWVWKHGATEFSQMSNVSKKLRERLEETYAIRLPKIITAQKSEDGTIKHLVLLDDNKTVETVWIPRDDQDRVTICVSSQVGCKMGCTFCLTAQQKVERNLAAGEIAAQLLVMPDRTKITNVVLMGMGEPFDNYDAVMGALSIMNSPDAFYIGARKITVSTSGLVPRIRQFLTESRFKLAVSLNAPNDEIRSQIMPINKAYPLDNLLGTVREIAADWKHGLYITWEYILIKDLNDQPEHAQELAKRLRGIPS
jgi:23S rRNA (adenine2503-C2)-methyltransferase